MTSSKQPTAAELLNTILERVAALPVIGSSSAPAPPETTGESSSTLSPDESPDERSRAVGRTPRDVRTDLTTVSTTARQSMQPENGVDLNQVRAQVIADAATGSTAFVPSSSRLQPPPPLSSVHGTCCLVSISLDL